MRSLSFLLASFALIACSGEQSGGSTTSGSTSSTSTGTGAAGTGGAGGGGADAGPKTPVPAGCILHDLIASSVWCMLDKPYYLECPKQDLPGPDCVQLGQHSSGYYADCCP